MSIPLSKEGERINIGDTVTTKFRGCVGHEFTVKEISPYQYCGSGFLVVVHLKGDPSRELHSKFALTEGRPQGLDAHWFSLVKTESHV